MQDLSQVSTSDLRARAYRLEDLLAQARNEDDDYRRIAGLCKELDQVRDTIRLRETNHAADQSGTPDNESPARRLIEVVPEGPIAEQIRDCIDTIETCRIYLADSAKHQGGPCAHLFDQAGADFAEAQIAFEQERIGELLAEAEDGNEEKACWRCDGRGRIGSPFSPEPCTECQK